MPTASISWRHGRRQLFLPAFLLPGLDSDNPGDSVRVTALLDTGATSTGIRLDVAEQLGLRQKGMRRVGTANGLVTAPEYVVRLGFVRGDYDDPGFRPDAQLPYVLDRAFNCFGLQNGFSYQALIGMDLIGESDLIITRDGRAHLTLP